MECTSVGFSSQKVMKKFPSFVSLMLLILSLPSNIGDTIDQYGLEFPGIKFF
jgi:hypothetical protein